MIMNRVSDNNKLYERHPKEYMVISKAMAQIERENFERFMGEEFKTPPKLTQQELETQIHRKDKRIEHLVEMKAPRELIEQEENKLTELLDLTITGKNIIGTAEEQEYYDRYQEKAKEYQVKRTLSKCKTCFTRMIHQEI